MHKPSRPQRKPRPSTSLVVIDVRALVSEVVRNISARANLSAVVEPLLNLIRQYTGYHLVLFAGIPLKDGTKPFDLKT